MTFGYTPHEGPSVSQTHPKRKGSGNRSREIPTRGFPDPRNAGENTSWCLKREANKLFSVSGGRERKPQILKPCRFGDPKIKRRSKGKNEGGGK